MARNGGRAYPRASRRGGAPLSILDSSFSGDGRLTLDLGTDDHASDVQVLSDGTILVAGTSYSNSAGGRTALVWLTPSGSLNPAYGGGDGKAIVALLPGGGDEVPVAVFVLGSGKIVIVGDAAGPATPGEDVMEARLTASGAKDHTFGGGDGVVFTDGGSDDFVNNATRLPDGRVLVALSSQDFRFAVLRLRPDGTADPTFGNGGYARPFPDHPGAHDGANDVYVRGDGRIVATGTVDSLVTTARLQD